VVAALSADHHELLVDQERRDTGNSQFRSRDFIGANFASVEITGPERLDFADPDFVSREP